MAFFTVHGLLVVTFVEDYVWAMPNPNFPTSNTPPIPHHYIYHALRTSFILFFDRRGGWGRDGWEKWGNKWPAKAALLLPAIIRPDD